MRVLNFGSLNIDYVYQVDEFLLPGETRPALSRSVIPGGKGLNQSVALAKAGAEVYHAGIIGNDGDILRNVLLKNNIHTDYLLSQDETGGHTIIQVNKKGQNKILLYGGTNRKFTGDFVDKTLACFGTEDVLLVQNETNLVDYIIEKASERGLKTVFNAAPISGEVMNYPLELVDWLIVNEIEGAMLAGTGRPEEILRVLGEKYKNSNIFLTLGPDGSCCSSKDGVLKMPAIPVEPVVDTTAAGDTFIGYLIQAYIEGLSIKESMIRASVASSLSIQKLGAVTSIPSSAEVETAFREWKSRQGLQPG
jgi:ribokinase